MSRRIRSVAAYLAAFCLFGAVFAASAFAGQDGEGLAGETTDKTVTLVSLGVVLFFVFVVVVGSIIQGALDRRKQQAKAARMRQRTGW
jgi:membrane protease YdiL (CAAX protease family)